MTAAARQGAVGAILGEYQRAIQDLQQTIRDISEAELTAVADNTTPDENCKSIQSVLTHLVSSGYSYAVYIGQQMGLQVERPAKVFHRDVKAYESHLQDMFDFTSEVFGHIHDKDLECYEDSGKIKTLWGQSYDIEQMMEHAIVHILRHRRQIKRFKAGLRK